MAYRKTRLLWGAAVLCLWVGLILSCWFSGSTDISQAERRKLAQMPDMTLQTLLDGSFMSRFESYTQDQFPLRDAFRTAKALSARCLFAQKDNHGVYLSSGSLGKIEYPLNTASVEQAKEKFTAIYDAYLKGKGSRIFFSVVPDKGFFLAEPGGYPAMDYTALFSAMESLPWAEYVDISPALSQQSYYRTDTHWRQEQLLDVAAILAEALQIPVPRMEDYRQTVVDTPFYGVYHGQAALPIAPEKLVLLESDVLSGCVTYNYENQKNAAVYDMTKLDSRDLYDIYLSGPVSLLTIENPAAPQDRELIVFRDSFAGSLVPLLAHGYHKITLVDTRYLPAAMLGQYLEFKGQDVLFLYSTLVLNNSAMLR